MTKKTASHKYTCANCLGEFETGWTDEEALAEYEQQFPRSHAAGEEMAMVCDDCYKQMADQLPPAEDEVRRYGEE